MLQHLLKQLDENVISLYSKYWLEIESDKIFLFARRKDALLKREVLITTNTMKEMEDKLQEMVIVK